jgi:hypothetical protein
MSPSATVKKHPAYFPWIQTLQRRSAQSGRIETGDSLLLKYQAFARVFVQHALIRGRDVG